MTCDITFGEAIAAAKDGKSILRAGWNGTGMRVTIIPGSHDFASKGPAAAGTNIAGVDSTLFERGDVGTVTRMPHFQLKTAQGTIVPWLASQTDMLASDWIAN